MGNVKELRRFPLSHDAFTAGTALTGFTVKQSGHL
eukprot:CAMPEP_0172803472 /NCGR_PEP_ID=MMETSP1075-20121228/4527_1 /TAXON_ID=2916 /ORGANISM="Ceratium fusus, Strain PA161109" /LENGTH=34 /DNA_ID= /DNA_START= /DNA_END= /DNA_ORIENTATION=